jgi:hypothetical protein
MPRTLLLVEVSFFEKCRNLYYDVGLRVEHKSSSHTVSQRSMFTTPARHMKFALQVD